MKTAPSMSDAAMGKLSLGAKALTEGGFDKLYKQTFSSGPDEHLQKTFACYLSTATGPVAGTLYLTNMNVAFCSDRPLSFTAPSGQTAWSYYKVQNLQLFSATSVQIICRMYISDNLKLCEINISNA